MSGLEMPGKGGGLEMPKRGESARLLQELNAQHAPAPPNEEDVAPPERAAPAEEHATAQISTAVSKPVSIGVSAGLSTHSRDEGNNADSEEGRSSVSKKGRTRGRTPRPVPAISHDAPEEQPAVRRATAHSLTRADKEPVTRLSIDVPESMYNRLKDYIHDKRIESTRALTLALYEDFLTEEGY